MSWFTSLATIFYRLWLGRLWDDTIALWDDTTALWDERRPGGWNSTAAPDWFEPGPPTWQTKSNTGWYT